MEDLKKLDRIVDDWQRQVEPNRHALTVAHVMMRNAQEDPEWCSHIVGADRTSADEGAGLNVDEMLSFGLMILNHITPE
jgi:hypothetical protein